MDRPRRLALPVVGTVERSHPDAPNASPAVPEAGRPSSTRAGEDLGPDPARVAAGWEHRFVAVGARIEEVVTLYRELGFEVAADPVPGQGLDEGCQACFSSGVEVRAIYTRRRVPSADSPEPKDEP